MIHHLSLPARDTRRVAEVLLELMGGAGTITEFGPYERSWIAWSGDEHGTALEVYPVGTELHPAEGAREAEFHHDSGSRGFTATHCALSVPLDEEAVHAIARREGWRAVRLPRGGFDVIELWVENRVLVEVLTAEMAADYLSVVPRRG
jgi:hypothetical protein